MNTPQVTVLMSVFNGIDYLEHAVVSILTQSFGDFEFIIVNDGSTEPVMGLLRQFDDPRLILIDQENLGLTRSLNKGLLLSRGAYIARMDGDDLSLPNRLERQVSALESNPHCDLVACFYEVIGEEGTVCDRKILIQDPIYRLWRLQFHNVYAHGTVMLRKSAVVAAGGYDESFTVAQDYELWSQLSSLNNTLVIPDILYQYRLIDKGTQSSIKHYDAQLANAIRTSNKNLKACRPDFSDKDCEDVRSVFWKFQSQTPSLHGIDLVTPTLDGFCVRFGIPRHEKDILLSHVIRDVEYEIEADSCIGNVEKKRIIRRFRDGVMHRHSDITF